MAKEQATKKKTVKTSNARAKAKKASPAASTAEPATTEPGQEQAVQVPENNQDATAQEQDTGQQPVKKPKNKRPAKKKKPAGEKKEEEKLAAKPGADAKPADEQKPRAEEEQKSLAPEAKDAVDEAMELKKPKRKPKGRSKKAKKPSAEETFSAEEIPAVEKAPAAEEKAEPAVQAPKKKSKKKPAKKKPTPPGMEQKPGVQRVVVASANPAKVKAAELGFSRMFPNKEFSFLGMSIDSGVTDQPMTDDETFVGALNRAMSAREEQPEAEFWIGLEGGLQEEGDDFYAFAWIVILGPDGLQGKSRTGTFAIPPAVTELVRNGKELGEADDIVFEQTNSKQNSGAIGILTHGILDRAAYYAEAVLMALIPFKNPALYLLKEEVDEEV